MSAYTKCDYCKITDNRPKRKIGKSNLHINVNAKQTKSCEDSFKNANK